MLIVFINIRQLLFVPDDQMIKKCFSVIQQIPVIYIVHQHCIRNGSFIILRHGKDIILQQPCHL